MIPKIIHYVWLGNQPMGELGQRCMASWSRFLPGWEIRRWDETNSNLNHPYVKMMMKRRLYAFASDYLRLEALLQQGGLYLDTDVELFGDPSDCLAFEGLTLGMLSLQNRLLKCSVSTSFVAACPANPTLKKIEQSYNRLNRAVMNNTLFTREVLPSFRRREIPEGGYFDFLEENGIRLYHPDFFNPVRQEEKGKTVPEPKKRSLAIHYGTGAWFGKQDPPPFWQRLASMRLDRKLLRPIEKNIKRFLPTKTRSALPSSLPGPIPRIAHYVWLGKKPLSRIGQKCLESWQNHLPGWEIRRWDETNSPVDHPFVKSMLANGKYAFASDYIRLFVLAEMGGLYLDTDLELIGGVDSILNRGCVLAFLSAQNRPSKNSAAMGFFAAVPGHPWVLELKRKYDRLDQAIMNTTLTTQSLWNRGLKALDRQSASQDYWDLGDIRIYHSDFFYPPGAPQAGFQCTFRTLGIHHAEGSWHGQAAAPPFWQKVKDLRLDRKILRPIEQLFKRVRR